MAKGQMRSNREAKKPKKEKPKAGPPPSPFAAQGKSGGAKTPVPGKKK
jgi:hypothetical protein